MSAAWRASAALIVVGLVASLAGGQTSPGGAATPEPQDSPSAATPAATPVPTVVTADEFDPPPSDCGGPAPRQIDPAFAPAVGAPPAWAVGFVGPQATLSVTDGGTREDLELMRRTRYGWTRKVLWVLEPGQPVTLRGGSLGDGAPLWFQFDGERPTTAPVLDPRFPEARGGRGNWREFPSYVYIPAAGCYFLEARWAGGSWRLTFAAGR